MKHSLTTPQTVSKLHHRLASDQPPSCYGCKQMTPKPLGWGVNRQEKHQGWWVQSTFWEAEARDAPDTLYRLSSFPFSRTLIMLCQETTHCLPRLLPGYPRPVPTGPTSLLALGCWEAAMMGRTCLAASPSLSTHVWGGSHLCTPYQTPAHPWQPGSMPVLGDNSHSNMLSQVR